MTHKTIITKVIFAILLLLSVSIKAQTENFKIHRVMEGETLLSIAEQYSISVSDIYALNPEAKTTFKTNTVLVIPTSKDNNQGIPKVSKEIIAYRKHKVRRKETLFSIAKKYEITVEDIKKANRRLYSENLKKGDRIEIPRFKTVIEEQKPKKDTLKTYTVLPKEGKWRVAYKFGITIEALEALNPNMEAVLQAGTILKVPNIEITEEQLVSDTLDYYEVLPKEGFFRLKVKLNLSRETLETLNPDLKKTGLQAGMILKIPKQQPTAIPSDTTKVYTSSIINLTEKLSNYKVKKLALVMPYNLNKINIDSVKQTKSFIQKNQRLSAVLDFHKGVLMALDSAKQLGISTKLKVFDSQYSVSGISDLANSTNFSDFDAVIGPLKQDCIDVLAMRLQKDNVPLIIPMTKPKRLFSNMFQTIAKDELLKQSIINFVQNDSVLASNILIITNHAYKNKLHHLKTAFPHATILYSNVSNETGEDEFFIYEVDIQKQIKPGRTTVFLETKNNDFASNVISLLNGLINEDTEITLLTTDKNKAFDTNIENNHLSNLNFHHPSVYKSITAEDSKSELLQRYKQTYGVYPNRYTLRGFDITLDVLLRLAAGSDFYEVALSDIETEYLENKFKYVKTISFGYKNESIYIVKHNNLKVENVILD